jgi:hypothetical protein
MGEAARAIRIHGWTCLRAALEAVPAGGALLVVSADGAGGHAGAGWFKALIEQAERARPDLRLTAVLDCADKPGHVLAALRAGVRDIAFQGNDAAAARLAGLAAESGARLHRALPDSLDLRHCRDAVATARTWLSG